MGATTDLTGDWIIDDGASTHALRLTQLGTHVSGVYDLQQGSIDGNVEGKHLKLRWDQPGNRRGGEAQMVVMPDGLTITGTWSYDPRMYDSGLTGSGQWTFRRSTSSPGGISVPNFWSSMKESLSAEGWMSIAVPGFPIAVEKYGWAVGMVDVHPTNATAVFYDFDQWIERNKIASSRLLVAVFDSASQHDVETITGLRRGNRMSTQAVASVMEVARRKFHPPKPAVWNPLTGLSNEPDFKKEIAEEIQDALNRVVGVH